MDSPLKKPKLTPEAKKQLIENLEFEVTHRTRQLETWLNHALQNFTVQQENQVTHISKQVRNLTMREFMEKYNGNVHTALKGIQKERLKALGEIAEDGEPSPKKRKWPIGHEDGAGAGAGPSDVAESSKSVKNARLMPATPKRIPPSSGAQRKGSKAAGKASITGAGPSTSRIPSLSPHKSKLNSFAFPRPGSPSKPQSPSKLNNNARRPPSSATFNPSIPKTPAYPGTRLPRRDEKMLSTNGSPLANPYELGVGWFKGVELGEQANNVNDNSNPKGATGSGGGGGGLKRTKSVINIRRDPSFAHGSGTSSGLHTRTNSQASFFTSTSSSSLPSTNLSTTHSRSESQIVEPAIYGDNHCTPKPARFGSAFVAIPTRDGHLLEFDPLLTSPGSIEALEGITESAKKQAREEMGRLAQAAVDKWKIS